MNTVGYLLILFSLLLIRGLTKGRGITQLPQDMSDGFIALIRNDQTAMREIAGRTGDALAPVAVAVPVVESGTTGAAPSGGGSVGGLVATTRAGRTAIDARFPGLTIGGLRLGPTAQDHALGKALDVMVYKDRLKGYEIATFVQGAAKTGTGWGAGVTYVIWDQKIWSVARDGEGWRGMPDRRGLTANHKDHVHVSFK